MNANEQYRHLLGHFKHKVAGPAPRGLTTFEHLGVVTKVSMRNPVVTIPERKLNYRFMVAEAYWILSGCDRLDMLTDYCKNMAKFSDDGKILSGAYGPRFISQLPYVCTKLMSDWETRQAVITLWIQNPRPSKDIPCTVSLQWVRRHGQLHCNVFMRSSDSWLGWPYDVFSFTMMTAMVASITGISKLGELTIFAGSQHLYVHDHPKAMKVLESDPKDDGINLDIDISRFIHPDVLLDTLGDIRNAPNDNVLALLSGAFS